MQDNQYLPIRVSTLRGDLKIPFDVFIHVAGKYIHYCRRGESFEGTRIERLRSKKLTKMFIRPEDEVAYRQYMGANMDVAFDEDKPLEIRAEVIQGFQQAAVEQYVEEPDDQLAYRHAYDSVRRLVQFVTDEPEGTRAILAIKNTDFSVSHHSVNVATLGAAMAIEANLEDKKQLDALALGCLLHDIEHFFTAFDLSRPLKSLSEEEMRNYKKHPSTGAHHLRSATFIDPLVLTIIAQHEEHVDGTGFPQGLRGSDVHPLAMIAATANAFDRLVSFEQLDPKDALKSLLIEKLGAYPLPNLQCLQRVLKKQKMV